MMQKQGDIIAPKSNRINQLKQKIKPILRPKAKVFLYNHQHLQTSINLQQDQLQIKLGNLKSLQVRQSLELPERCHSQRIVLSELGNYKNKKPIEIEEIIEQDIAKCKMKTVRTQNLSPDPIKPKTKVLIAENSQAKKNTGRQKTHRKCMIDVAKCSSLSQKTRYKHFSANNRI